MGVGKKEYWEKPWWEYVWVDGREGANPERDWGSEIAESERDYHWKFARDNQRVKQSDGRNRRIGAILWELFRTEKYDPMAKMPMPPLTCPWWCVNPWHAELFGLNESSKRYWERKRTEQTIEDAQAEVTNLARELVDSGKILGSEYPLHGTLTAGEAAHETYALFSTNGWIADIWDGETVNWHLEEHPVPPEYGSNKYFRDCFKALLADLPDPAKSWNELTKIVPWGGAIEKSQAHISELRASLGMD